MREETFRFLQIGILCCSTFILPGIILLITKTKKTVKEHIDLEALSQEITSHILKCDKIPKEVIVEKLDHLTSKMEDFCDRLDEQREDIKEVKKDFKEEIGFQRKRYHELDGNLTKILLKMHLEIKEDGKATTV